MAIFNRKPIVDHVILDSESYLGQAGAGPKTRRISTKKTPLVECRISFTTSHISYFMLYNCYVRPLEKEKHMSKKTKDGVTGPSSIPTACGELWTTGSSESPLLVCPNRGG